MAASSTAPISTSSSFLRSSIHHQNHQFTVPQHRTGSTKTFQKKQTTLRVQAAKIPAGVELPKVEPKFEPPFLGFTRSAETWNSRACMIGLIGTFAILLSTNIINKGILQVIGVDIGKGLDLPL